MEVGATRLVELAEHADRLVGVVWAVRTVTGKRSGSFLASKVWVLLEQETPPVRDVGGVNDRFQSGPVEGAANEDSDDGYDLAEPLLGKAKAEPLRELRRDLGNN